MSDADKITQIRGLIRGYRAGGWDHASAWVRSTEVLVDRIEVIVAAEAPCAQAPHCPIHPLVEGGNR
ncbi:hypothetical protein VSH64_24960 [Amycolatopsis rhabdoformis]|uniref:Uncharacterized protein n=1 Tax=Amycolatopsis rhabdoformis TaxID=1448059 RepID=A0ABZ1HUU3_9PSEU|nr:hypothetical protein [Amycolatopsis rhabdoformis]WSE26129.1 hypothetical protein VSH64_24960 [Amycolatopsis rhabdoformis]